MHRKRFRLPDFAFKIPGKEGEKRSKKQGNSLRRKKQGNPKKQGKGDQGGPGNSFARKSGNRFLSSTGVGKSCALPIRVPNPSPTLDKNLAFTGPGILSSVGVGVGRKYPEALPDSNTTLDNIQSVNFFSYQRIPRNYYQYWC